MFDYFTFTNFLQKNHIKEINAKETQETDLETDIKRVEEISEDQEVEIEENHEAVLKEGEGEENDINLKANQDPITEEVKKIRIRDLEKIKEEVLIRRVKAEVEAK